MESAEEKKSLSDEAEELLKQASGIISANTGQVVVREWIPYNLYELPDSVEAAEIPWSVPTVQRLWFG